MNIRRILAGVILAALLALPVIASEGSVSDVPQNEVVDVSPSGESEPDSHEDFSTANVESNQQTMNNNIVFCAASIMSLGGLLCGFFTGKDLFTW